MILLMFGINHGTKIIDGMLCLCLYTDYGTVMHHESDKNDIKLLQFL